MTIARSITQKAEIIHRMCAWIGDDVADGGYSTADSMGQNDLRKAAALLRAHAAVIEEQADALLANAPSALEPHHEPTA